MFVKRLVYTNYMLYFFQGVKTRLIKIGVTTRSTADERLKACQLGSPDKLILLGCRIELSYIDETKLHNKYKHLNTHGEWFEETQELLDEIKDIIKNGMITTERFDDKRLPQVKFTLDVQDIWRMV